MNKLFKNIIIGLIIIAIPLINVNRSSIISNYSWKSVSKYQVTAWMDFNDGYLVLDGKTIRLAETNEKKGIVILSLYKYLIVKNTEGRICYYTSKG